MINKQWADLKIAVQYKIKNEGYRALNYLKRVVATQHLAEITTDQD